MQVFLRPLRQQPRFVGRVRHPFLVISQFCNHILQGFPALSHFSRIRHHLLDQNTDIGAAHGDISTGTSHGINQCRIGNFNLLMLHNRDIFLLACGVTIHSPNPIKLSTY